MKTLLVALVAFGVIAPAAHAHHPVADPIDEPEKGLVYKGLEPTSVGPCAGGFKIVNTPRCTHGPDPAPPGLNPKAKLVPLGTPPPKVSCVGNGTTGKRVQALYVRASDVADGYAAAKATIATAAIGADRIYRESAAQTSGTRRIRWLHDAYCNLEIDNVVVNPVDDDSLALTTAALAARGYNSVDRKYLMFVDATVYCGIGERWNDDRWDPAVNLSNIGPNYARTDAGCWTGSVAAHELTHNLGGVQLSAPNSSGGGHCTDENDRMCYSDKPFFPVMNFICAAAEEQHLDCNKDDYFNTSPPAGSYLDTNWNVADNDFLASTAEDHWGFVHADDPAAAAYTPSDTANQNSTNQKNTIVRVSQGRYEVTFPNLASMGGDSGTALATAYGSAGEHCSVSSWTSSGTPDMTVTVRCYSAAGATADVRFDASYIRPTSSTAPFAYLWAEDETNAGYIPSTYHQFNSTGATNTVFRNGTGDYTAVLPNVDAAAGTAKVTAFGATGAYCKAADWDSSGVNVLCFDATGAPADTKFTLAFAEDASILANGAPSGYVWVNDGTTTLPYTPNSAYQYNSTGVSNTVARTATGLYTVSLPGLGVPLAATNRGTVHITAHHTHNKRCEVVSWSSSFAPFGQPSNLSVNVACHTSAGTPSDSRFVLQYSR